MRIHLDEQDVEFGEAMVRSAYHFTCDAVEGLRNSSQEGWEWHYKVMYGWMTKIVVLGAEGSIAPGSEKWAGDAKRSRHLWMTTSTALTTHPPG